MTHLQLLIESQQRVMKLERHIGQINKGVDVVDVLHKQISAYQKEIRRLLNRLFRYSMDDGTEHEHRYALLVPSLETKGEGRYTTITTMADKDEALSLAHEMLTLYDLHCEVMDTETQNLLDT